MPHDELPRPEHYGPVIRSQVLSLGADTHAPITAFGGLSLVKAFLRRFKVSRCLDAHIHVLKLNLPYVESDHIFGQGLNKGLREPLGYVSRAVCERAYHQAEETAVAAAALSQTGECQRV